MVIDAVENLGGPVGPSPALQTPSASAADLYLGGDLGLGVGDLDADLLCAADDVDALAGRNVVGDPISLSVNAILRPEVRR